MTTKVNKEWLYEEYVVKNRRAEDIAKELGCHKSNVSYLANTKWRFHKRRRVAKGMKFGKLTIVDIYHTKGKHGHPVCLCQCDCGNLHKVLRYALLTGSTRSCGCLRPNQSPYHDYIGKRLWGSLKRNARTRQIPFEVSIEYVWKLFEKQNSKCALSQLLLTMNENASLDRIDSSRGYIEGNLQWVHKDINTMKWDLTQERFIQLCKMVAQEN